MLRFVLFSLLVVALAVGGWFLWPFSQLTDQDLSDAATSSEVRQPIDCDRSIFALGYLQPRDGVISVNGTPGDQLSSLEIHEGDGVTKNQLLGTLKSEPLRQLEWKAQKSQADQAAKLLEAELEAADKRIAAAKLAQEKIAIQKLEEDAQQAQITFLAKNLDLNKKNLDRLQGVSESLISVQKREQQELLFEKTHAELEAAKQKLEGMIASREFAEKTAKAELAVAEAGRAQILAADKSASLRYATDIAKLQHEQTQLKAPIAGTILHISVEPGETLGAQPILQMANLDQMVCHAEVFETDIQCVHVGQAVRVTSPAFPIAGETPGIRGTVKRISQIVAPPELKSLDPYAAADRHVVDVEIEFDQEASQIAAQFVNLQVEVEFLAKSTP